MGRMSRQKGKRGETEIVRLLQAALNKVYGVGIYEVKRNLMQSQQGGYDVVGVPGFGVEVKYYKEVTPGMIRRWWQQAQQQVVGKPLLPMLCWRKNGGDWYICLMEENGGMVQMEYKVALEEVMRIWQRRVRYAVS